MSAHSGCRCDPGSYLASTALGFLEASHERPLAGTAGREIDFTYCHPDNEILKQAFPGDIFRVFRSDYNNQRAVVYGVESTSSSKRKFYMKQADGLHELTETDLRNYDVRFPLAGQVQKLQLPDRLLKIPLMLSVPCPACGGRGFSA